VSVVTTDLCRDIAVEAVHRGAQVNVHELWALLEMLDETRPVLVVDVGSEPAVWWAWWSMGCTVIAVSHDEPAIEPAFSSSALPSSVTALVGDPVDVSTSLRVRDQVAGRPVDMLVMAGAVNGGAAAWAFDAYRPLVRGGGVVLLRGIAAAASPMGVLWRGDRIAGAERTELIGADDPDGYGIVMVPRKVSHG
jgi:hypothetical protein